MQKFESEGEGNSKSFMLLVDLYKNFSISVFSFSVQLRQSQISRLAPDYQKKIDPVCTGKMIPSALWGLYSNIFSTVFPLLTYSVVIP